MNVGHWYVRRGRIDRRTYWLHYFLPLYVLYLIVEVIAVVSATGSGATTSGGLPAVFWLPGIVYLLTIVPQISAQVTRLHDRGHSAWWLCWAFLPFAGAIVLLVQMCLPGEPGPNAYGPPPGSAKQIPDPPYPTTYG